MELKRIHQRIKGTVIYVTHDQIEAMTLGDSVVIMNAGKIHQASPPRVIYERPADKFVATFIGFPEMNFLKGTVVDRKGTFFFEGNGFTLDLGSVTVNDPSGDWELGLRPEDIQILPQRSTPLEIDVELVSNIGSESVVNARLGPEAITIIAPKDTLLKPGDKASISVAPERIHRFRNGVRT
jgi:multiple sugar transport system ATP-binding protein